MYSVSKSVVALLVGIALDKGMIQGLDQKVLDFFPNYMVKKKETTIQEVTLRDLLTMTAPYKYKDSFLTYAKYFRSRDCLHFSLDQLGGKQPVGVFRYTPLIGPDILSGILTRVTGKSVLEFATEVLFAPLGIHVEKKVVFHSMKEQMAFNSATDISGWVADPQGLNTGGWRLTLSVVDMAKLGQVYLDDGMWNGKQIVSPQWIQACTQKHSCWKEKQLDYGYLWWLICPEENACAAMGDGGNTIYFNKKKGLVVSIASAFVKNPKDRIELIQKYIEPAFEE